jgi:Microcystin-dependent protein
MRGLNLLASLVRETPDISLWSWATVTDDSPLRVQLDGELAALDVTPDTLVAPLAVDDRVWVQLVTNANPTRRYRRLVVLGRAGCPFPIGHIYYSTASTNPGTLFGGTWTRIQDRFLLAAGSTYAAASTGGAATHTLTVAEMPVHAHGQNVTSDVAAGSGVRVDYNADASAASFPQGISTDNAGSGNPHNNMPPYLAVYVWERTA